MDDEFENIILDEVDDLNGLESLREKTNKNKENNNNNSNKKIITNNNIDNNKNKKESESKEISEEYNDFDYNIEENKDNKIINENNLNNLINSDNKKEKEEKKYNYNENDKKEEIINEKNNDNNDKENDSFNAIKLVEDNYISLKNELEMILTKVEFNEIKEITEQNNQLIKYSSQLEEIMSSIIKIFPKGEKLLIDKLSKIRKLEKKKTKEEKEKKIIEIYKNEYLDLEKKYKLIKDPIYKESLLNNLTKLKREYEIITEENKNLKEEQKMSEINIEKKSKNVKKEEKMLKE